MDVVYLTLLAAAIALNAASAFYKRLWLAGFLSLSTLVVYHYFSFFSGNFRLALVYINAAVGQSALERATAAVASIPGAVYLIALPASALGGRAGRLAAALLLTYVAVERPYVTVDDVIPGYVPQSGMGLNPLLRSIWAVPHPLAVLLGYGLFIAAVNDRRLFVWGWLFTSLGLLLGAVWSYQTFGWSGYWAWDPVENALLAVWLVATAAMHLGNRGGRLATVGAVLGAVGLNQGGYSALHSFVGSTPAPQVMLIASLVLLSYGMYKAIDGVRDVGLAISALGMASLGVVIYMAGVAPALYSIATSTPMQPPAGDFFTAYFLYPIAAAVLAGFFLASIYYGARLKTAVLLFAAILAASVVLSWFVKPAFESPAATNFFIYATAAGALAASYWVARSKHSLLHKTIHITAFMLLVLVAISGPFSYGQKYYKLLAVDNLDAVYFTLLNWPYAQRISLGGLETYVDNRIVEIPPTVQLIHPPNYTAYVKKFGGKFDLGGLNYTIIKAGVPYVVVWSGGREVGRVGGVPIVEVEKNGTAVVFPAPLDLVNALAKEPKLVEKFLKCRNQSRLVPGGVITTGFLYIDGVSASFATRYDASGWLKGVGATTLGVVDVYKPAVSHSAIVLHPTAVGETMETIWDYVTAKYALLLLEQCNAPAAYTVLSTVGVRNLTTAVEYLQRENGVWVVAFKPTPAMLELWITSTVLLLLVTMACKKIKIKNYN